MRRTFHAEFDIDSVQINGQEINDILSEDQLDDRKCINQLED
jgi:hypothetical protein